MKNIVEFDKWNEKYSEGNGLCKLGFEDNNSCLKLDDVIESLSYYAGNGYHVEVVNSCEVDGNILVFEFEPKFRTVSVLVHNGKVINVIKAER